MVEDQILGGARPGRTVRTWSPTVRGVEFCLKIGQNYHARDLDLDLDLDFDDDDDARACGCSNWPSALVLFFMLSAAEPALLDASTCLHALACGVWYVLRCWILLTRGRVSGIADVCVCWLCAFAPNGEHHNPSRFSSCAFGVCFLFLFVLPIKW